MEIIIHALKTKEEVLSMSYNCCYCDKEAKSAHSITVYNKNGTEERFEVLCSPCYAEWLLSLKG
jgi:transcription elongation factor Elf1